MGRLLSYLLLALLAFASWLALKFIRVCIKRGGIWRLLAAFASLLSTGLCIGFGYWLVFIGCTEQQGSEIYQVTYPVAGWIGIVAGVFFLLVGIWRSLTMTKQEAEQEEVEEKLDEEIKKEAELKKQREEHVFKMQGDVGLSAKEAARAILKQRAIGKYKDLYGLICDTLVKNENDRESVELLEQLRSLKND